MVITYLNQGFVTVAKNQLRSLQEEIEQTPDRHSTLSERISERRGPRTITASRRHWCFSPGLSLTTQTD
ncbi:MAG: hypothetical protein GVY04_03625 [Cyanobacteria bacterium]|nr:hypothetical protein [Cyanobacteria bacterium GSL.Bin1]